MQHIELFLQVASFLFPLGLAVLLFRESKKNSSLRIMAAALLHTSIIFFCVYFYLQEEYSFYYYLHALNAAMQFSVFPVIYLYIKSVIGDKKENMSLWHFMPTILMFCLATYIFYIHTAKTDLLYFLKNNRRGVHFLEFKYTVLIVSRYVHLSLVVIQGVVYSIAFARVPKYYNEQLKNEFSNVENFSLGWINRYNLGFVSVVAVGFLLYGFLPLKGYLELFIVGTFFLFSAYVCTMGVVAMKQQKANVNLDDLDFSADTDKTSTTWMIIDTELVKKLNSYMEEKKAYLDPELSLTTLSRDLGTNRTYLSLLINRHFGVNFNTYINQYRVCYVKQYVVDNPAVSKEELCQIGGFGSISTMKRALNAKPFL